MTRNDEQSIPSRGSVVEPPIANHYDGRMWVEADRYTELLVKYATLAAETRWIPVTERLPDAGGVFPYVLAKIGGMHYPAIARRSESSSGWVELGDARMFAAWEITHWMPLPEADFH